MEMNDPLRYKTYGVKRDYTQKDHIHYPQNKDGVVDEWKALLDNWQRQHQQEQKVRAEQKKVNQQEYRGVLDQIKTQQEKQRMQEQVVKAQDYQDMIEKSKVLNEYQKIKKEEDNQLKNYLSHTYKNFMEESIQKKQDEIFKEKLEDQERLKKLKIDNEEDMKRRLQEKNEYIDVQNRFKEYRVKLKENEKEEERRKHEDYIKQCEENENLLKAKEKMYKQFFQNFEQSMTQRARVYLDKVLEEEIKKDMAMRNWETNGNDPLYNKLTEERIRMEVNKRLKDASEITEFNKYLIEEHGREKERQMEIARLEQEVRKKKEEELRRVEEQRKIEERQNQKMYSDTLQFQSNVSQRMRKNFGTMTEQEKKINRMDLKSYKENDNVIHSMIPGIHNIQSVGSTPLLRKGNQQKAISNSTINGLNIETSQNLGRYEDLASSQSMYRNLSVKELGGNSNLQPFSNQQFQRYEEHPIKDSIHTKKVYLGGQIDAEQMRQSFDQKKTAVGGYYNTITNPVPNYNQNPYIAKERNRISGQFSMGGNGNMLLGQSQSKNVLAQAGNNILG